MQIKLKKCCGYEFFPEIKAKVGLVVEAVPADPKSGLKGAYVNFPELSPEPLYFFGDEYDIVNV